MRFETVSLGGQQQTIDRCRAARLVVIEAGSRRVFVQPKRDAPVGLTIAVVMGQVGAHHDKRLRPAPNGFEKGCNSLRVGTSDQYRSEREMFELGLQEGQLHLKAVLERVRGIRDDDPGRCCSASQCSRSTSSAPSGVSNCSDAGKATPRTATR